MYSVFLYFLLMLKVMIREFDDFLPTCFSSYLVNEVSQSLLDTQVETMSKGFSFVHEHGLSSHTPIARRNLQHIEHETSPQPFVKRKSPRLSAQKNVLPEKVPDTNVEDDVLPSSCDGK